MEDSMEIPLKTRNKDTMWPGNTTSGHYPEEIKTEKDTYTPMLIAALLTIAKTWKQPRCPLTDEWIKEAVVHIYNGILLSHKKECIWVSPNEVDEPRAYYTEWSKSEIEK